MRPTTVKISFSSKEKPFPRPFRVLFVPFLRLFRPFPSPFRVLSAPFPWPFPSTEKAAKRTVQCSGEAWILFRNFCLRGKDGKEEIACNGKLSCKNTEMMQDTQNNGRTRPVPKACLGLGAVMVGQKLVAVWWPVGQEFAVCGIEFRSRMGETSFSSKAESFSRPFSRLFSASIRPQLSFFYPFSRRLPVDEKDSKRIFAESMGSTILALDWQSTIKKKRVEREESSCNAKFSCKNTEMIQGGNASSVATLGGKVWTAF